MSTLFLSFDNPSVLFPYDEKTNFVVHLTTSAPVVIKYKERPAYATRSTKTAWLFVVSDDVSYLPLRAMAEQHNSSPARRLKERPSLYDERESQTYASMWHFAAKV